MYKVYIPLMGKIRTEKSWQKTIAELKRAKPDRVYIVYYRTLENAEAKKKAREVFKNNKDILENAGFKTGAWFCPTIGYGSPSPGDNGAEKHYRKIVGPRAAKPTLFARWTRISVRIYAMNLKGLPKWVQTQFCLRMILP